MPVSRSRANRYASRRQREGMRPRSRGAMRPRFALSFRPRKQEGAGKTGCALHPRSRVQNAQRKRTRAYRFSGGNPAFPAQWFYGLFRALPGDRAFLPPSSARSLLLANLTPASGRQDHTTSPSASAPFVIRASASTASHRAFVTIASRPSHRVGRAECTTDLRRS